MCWRTRQRTLKIGVILLSFYLLRFLETWLELICKPDLNWSEKIRNKTSRLIRFFFIVSSLLEIFQQYGKKQIQKDHHTDDYQAYKVKYGNIAVWAGELKHRRVPIFPSQDSKNENKPV